MKNVSNRSQHTELKKHPSPGYNFKPKKEKTGGLVDFRSSAKSHVILILGQEPS